MKNILIIGLGNMGQAIFAILKSTGKYEIFGCDRSDDPNQMIEKADVLIIAIKPQDFEAFYKSIKTDISEKLIISIMAGVSIGRLQKNLGATKVTRVMPNLPLRVSKAFAGWVCAKEVSQANKEITREILRELGEEIELEKEDLIDRITALSGSGPAYFYKLAESLEKMAQKYGFSDKQAAQIVRCTFIGAAELMAQTGLSPKELRAQITSKKGVTEAAITHLEACNFDKIVADALEANRSRSKELNLSKAE
ncbi:MAG: pyrroline-5-carboxylate reductase [Patescibacteria group bacterium]|nr:pyrroline-5-carboxylate reductase [Patescibacteria group bacterium]